MKQKNLPVACVDIGGTSIKSGLVENGQLQFLQEEPTEAHLGGEAVAKKAARAIRRFSGACAAGVSTAGEVDGSGTILLADNIPGYTGLPLAKLLAEATGLPIAVENDVNAAAIGEHIQGAAQGCGDFAMVCFGTGIGGAVFSGGRLLRGNSGSAGEFGGLITHPEAWQPGDIGSGSWERCASTSALLALAKQMDTGIHNGRDLFARANEPAAEAIIRGWIDEICFGLVGVVHCLNPVAIVLGGGIMQQPGLAGRIAARLLPMLKPSFRKIRVTAAHLGNAAALWGAASLAAQLL